jgi:DNA-binding NtrC family response regulator
MRSSWNAKCRAATTRWRASASTRLVRFGALGETPWDLVLRDFFLPASNALNVLAAIRSSGRDIPCIVISGSIDEDAAVDALRSGARDFIVKHRLARLLPAIARELREAREISSHFQRLFPMTTLLREER